MSAPKHNPRRRSPACQSVLITGGTRSGKSRYAVELAKRFGRRIAYLATCQPMDQEMRRRVARHRRQRPAHWLTIEHPTDLPETLIRMNDTLDAAIIDCLTLYLCEHLLQHDSDALVTRRVRELCAAIPRLSYPVILVTNEVGSGIVPEHPLGRRFRDLAGLANQTVAELAPCVVLMVAGIPVVLKGSLTSGSGVPPS